MIYTLTHRHHYHASYGPVLAAIAVCCIIAWLLGRKER